MMAAHAPRSETGPIMKASHFVGSRLYAAYALGAVALGAVALSALGSFVPDEALSALRAWIPREAPFLELVLLGWIGVALLVTRDHRAQDPDHLALVRPPERVRHPRHGREDVDGRVSPFVGNGAIEHDVPVERAANRVGDRIVVVVSVDEDGKDAGDRTRSFNAGSG